MQHALAKKWILIVLTILFIPVLSCTTSQQIAPSTPVQPIEKKPAKMETGPLNILPKEIFEGNKAIASVAITNTGDYIGIYKATLKIDGIDFATKELYVNPGQTQDLNFDIADLKEGKHTLELDNKIETTTVIKPETYLIQYDSSTKVKTIPEFDESTGYGYVNWRIGDAGHIVKFSPPVKPFYINRVLINGATSSGYYPSGNDTSYFDLNILDKDGKKIWSKSYLWQVFYRSASFAGLYWQEFEVPSIKAEDDFIVKVVTHSDSTKQLYIGSEIAGKQDIRRSGTFDNGTINYFDFGADNPFTRNWYIRVQGIGEPLDAN